MLEPVRPNLPIRPWTVTGPRRVEGFSLQLVEAFAFGRPVITDRPRRDALAAAAAIRSEHLSWRTAAARLPEGFESAAAL